MIEIAISGPVAQSTTPAMRSNTSPRKTDTRGDREDKREVDDVMSGADDMLFYDFTHYARERGATTLKIQAKGIRKTVLTNSITTDKIGDEPRR